MTDNEKIARWAGLDNWLNYQIKDQYAVLLLPILAEKDCTFKILGAPQNYYMEIAKGPGFCPMITVERQPTIAAAITAAILQLIADKP